ncbi:MAG: hypothetical protein WBA49_13355 [Rhodanobacter lindaniclasticus]
MSSSQPIPGQDPEQDDLVAQRSTSRPSENPFAHAASISISVPETVEVKLVDASALADYEVWVLLTSILSSAFIGFLVAAIQAVGKPSQSAWIAMSVILFILMAVCAFMAFGKRRRLSSKAKRLKFAVGEQVKDE